jgi:hypothetical protein
MKCTAILVSLANASAILDFLQKHAKGSTMYGFKGGPAGVMKCKHVELNTDFVYPYRNQVIHVLLMISTQWYAFNHGLAFSNVTLL